MKKTVRNILWNAPQAGNSTGHNGKAGITDTWWAMTGLTNKVSLKWEHCLKFKPSGSYNYFVLPLQRRYRCFVWHRLWNGCRQTDPDTLSNLAALVFLHVLEPKAAKFMYDTAKLETQSVHIKAFSVVILASATYVQIPPQESLTYSCEGTAFKNI